MHRLNPPYFSRGPGLEIVHGLHHSARSLGLVAAAVLCALLGLGLAIQIYRRSRNAGVSRSRFAPMRFVLGCLALLAGGFVAFRLSGGPMGNRWLPPRPVLGRTVHPLNEYRPVDSNAAMQGAPMQSHTVTPNTPTAPVDVASAPEWSSNGEPAPPEMPLAPESTASSKGPPVAPTASPTAVASASPTSKPVSSPPAAEIISPSEPQLPAWIREKTVGSDTRQLVVITGQFGATGEAAESAALASAVNLVRDDFASEFPDARAWNPPAQVVRSLAVRRSHVEQVNRKTFSTGTPFHVYRAYYQVEVSPAVRRDLLPHWKDEVVRRRLPALGGLAGLLTLTFGTMAGYFWLDDRTTGHYRRRLKLAAVSLIAAGGFAAALVL